MLTGDRPTLDDARVWLVLAALLMAASSRSPLLAAPPRDPLEVPKSAVLVTTTMQAGAGLSATLTEFFTGDKSEKTGINLLLGLYRTDGGRKELVAARDYNAQGGGFVSRGSLEVVDLDRDGVNEILVNYHKEEKPGMTRIDLDVLKVAPAGLVLAWSGPVRVDTAGASSPFAAAERERFSREIGYLRTAAAEGRKIYFTKTVSVAAGIVLDPPRVLEEELDLARDGGSKAR